MITLVNRIPPLQEPRLVWKTILEIENFIQINLDSEYLLELFSELDDQIKLYLGDNDDTRILRMDVLNEIERLERNQQNFDDEDILSEEEIQNLLTKTNLWLNILESL